MEFKNLTEYTASFEIKAPEISAPVASNSGSSDEVPTYDGNSFSDLPTNINSAIADQIGNGKIKTPPDGELVINFDPNTKLPIIDFPQYNSPYANIDLGSLIAFLLYNTTDLKDLSNHTMVKGKTGGSDKPDETGTAGAVNPQANNAIRIDQKTAQRIAEIQKQIKDFEQKLEGYEKQLETQKKLQAEAEEKMNQEQAKLDALNEKYNTNAEKYEQITKQIESASQGLEIEAKRKQEEAIYQAMADYNEEEHGDWNSYLQEKLGEINPKLASNGLVEFLSAQDSALCSQLANSKLEIIAQTQALTNAKNAYKAISETVSGIEKMANTEKNSISNLEKELTKIFQDVGIVPQDTDEK